MGRNDTGTPAFGLVPLSRIRYRYSRISTNMVFSTWEPPPVIPQARQYYVLKRGTKPKTGVPVPFPLKGGSKSGIFFLAKFHLFHQYALKLTKNL
jgi:hypothetical protein